MADAEDLKSSGDFSSWGFDSPPGHHSIVQSQISTIACLSLVPGAELWYFGIPRPAALPRVIRIDFSEVTMSSPLAAASRRALEILRWRGPTYFVLLAIRELFRPILYWYAWNIYETDLHAPLREPYAKCKFDVRIYRGDEHREFARAQLAKLPCTPVPVDFDARMKRGDAVAVVFSQDEAVASGWMTFTSGMDLAFGTKWVLGPGEGTQYSSFVLPKWRGHGIFSVLNVALNQYAREHGVQRSIGSISVLNTQSLSMARKLGKKKIMTVILLRFRGVDWTLRTAIGAPFRSRFTVEPVQGASLVGQPVKP